MIKLEIIQLEQEWKALSDPWNKLLSRSINNVPFLRHEFLFAWWQHRGGGEWSAEDQLYLIVGWDQDDELVAALPLFISKNHAGKPVLIGLGSHEISDFLDLLSLPFEHAVDPRDITGRGDNAAPPAADNDRLVPYVGIVPLLDGGIKGIAVNMGDREREQLVVAGNARAAAIPTPVAVIGVSFETVSAECWHLNARRN